MDWFCRRSMYHIRWNQWVQKVGWICVVKRW